MKVTCSSKTLLITYENTWRYYPKDHHSHAGKKPRDTDDLKRFLKTTNLITAITIQHQRQQRITSSTPSPTYFIYKPVSTETTSLVSGSNDMGNYTALSTQVIIFYFQR
jgi:hypothetical protein